MSWSLGGQDFGDALTILAALKLYFIARDEHGAEVAGWVARVAARPLPDSPDLAGALSTGGVLAWSVGDLDTAERLHQRSLSLARRAGSTGDVFRTIGDLGLVAMDRGRADRARDLFAEGLEIARAEGDPVWLAVALSNLGRVEAPERQHRLLAEALALHREAGRLTGIADVALMLGWLAVARGDLAGAHELFRESLTGWEDLANQGAMVIALCGLADVAALRGSEAGAFELLDRAEDVAEAVDWQPAIGLVLVRRGAIALDRGDGAEAPLRRARDRLEGSGLDAALAHTLGLLARATLPGDPDEAGALLQRSRDVWRALGRSDGMSWCAAATADLTRHRSGEEAALPLYAGALTSYALARGEPV